MRASSRELTRAIMEDVMEYLGTIIKPIGDYYHAMIRGYSNEDRGLSNAYELLEYLYGESKVWFNFVSRMARLSDGIRENLGVEDDFISKEFSIIEKISSRLEYDVKKSIVEALSRESKCLYPEEFSRIVDDFEKVRIYLDATHGRLKIMYDILETRNLKNTIEKYKNTVTSFLKKLRNENQGYNRFYMGKIADYSVLTFTIIDAYDNSFLLKLKKEYNEEFIHTYSPINGFDKVLFKLEEELKKENMGILRNRKEREMLCLPGALRRRVYHLGIDKLLNYVREVYETENSLYYIR